MSDLTARMREAIGAGRPAAPPRPAVRDRGDAAERLGGHVVEHPLGRCVVVDRDHNGDYRHGDVSLDDLAPTPGGCTAVARLLGASRPDAVDARSLFFVDLETTGLAGGAGTHAFLVGFGWFEDGSFRTRQFFLDRLGDEPALLDVAAERLRGAAIVASFNGKSFDVPLIETRYLFHRKPSPCAGTPHLDLLHPARRLWRGPDGCSLATLERQLFGVSRYGDVPGIEIPARYFAYVRGGSASLLTRVLEHNRSDLLSLALVAVLVGRLMEAGAPAARSAEECLGLGCLLEHIGEAERALACYERAVRLPWQIRSRRLEALRALARLHRRHRRHDEAKFAWEEIARAGVESRVAIEAVTALAIHHEHRSKDLPAAKQFATLALQAQAHLKRAAAEYRLARIDRKLERRAALGWLGLD
jgi:uncharacterized protein